MPRGMAVTLNGLAQGYVTDKLVELLRARGVAHSLVDMGEARAIGSHPDGRPWEIGIADPERKYRAEIWITAEVNCFIEGCAGAPHENDVPALLN